MGPYVTMVFAIFLIVFAGMTIPSDMTTCSWSSLTDSRYCDDGNATSSASIGSGDNSGFCRTPEQNEIITFQAPQDEATKCPNGPGGSYKSGGDHRNNFQGTTTYQLVRKRVPLNIEFFTKSDGSEHSTKAVDAGITTTLDPTKYEVYFPQISGEVKIEGNSPYSRTRDCGERSYENQGLVYFIDYGMVFALILENGKPVQVGGYYLTDVFKDTKRDDIPQAAFDLCSGAVSASASPTKLPKQQVYIPQQQESTNNAQLQLSYFLFSNGTLGNSSSPQYAAVNGWVDTCKPAVYLYPPTKQAVNVKVYPQGFLTYTDPLYDSKTGWIVDAYPDGNITTAYSLQPKDYPYLYYESKIKDEFINKPTKGWVVQSSVVSPRSSEWFGPLEKQFNDVLPKLGLNSVQTKDFIEYWKKALPYSPYYFVGVVDPANVDQIERLEITPKPDYINRVRIYFERLDTPKVVEAPVIVDQRISGLANQKGKNLSNQLISQSANLLFRVVEWGGMVKNDPNHPFTCSQ